MCTILLIIIFAIKPIITAIDKMIYKIEYAEYVTKYADEYGLDPNFIYAVIKTESSFDKNAVSEVGARGLMQIMPDTFQWINSKLSLTDITYDDMFNEELNIRFGCYLYGTLLNEFDSYEAAIAAYHAGRGAVNKWLKDKRYSSDGQTLDTIPIPNTAHYVDKLLKNYNQYKKLYK